MSYALLYVSILLSFCILDAIWLTSTVNVVYRPAMGDMLLASPRIAPLIVFYLMYPIALVIFAGVPAIRAGSVMPALIYGALFGAFAYATYDLTNFATLRNWTLQLSVIDMVWGTFASSVATGIGYIVATKLGAWFAS